MVVRSPYKEHHKVSNKAVGAQRGRIANAVVACAWCLLVMYFTVFLHACGAGVACDRNALTSAFYNFDRLGSAVGAPRKRNERSGCALDNFTTPVLTQCKRRVVRQGFKEQYCQHSLYMMHQFYNIIIKPFHSRAFTLTDFPKTPYSSLCDI